MSLRWTVSDYIYNPPSPVNNNSSTPKQLPNNATHAIVECVTASNPLSCRQHDLSTYYATQPLNVDPAFPLLMTSPTVAAAVIAARAPDRLALTFLRDLFEAGDKFYLSIDKGAQILRWLHYHRALLPRKILLRALVYRREGPGHGARFAAHFDVASILTSGLLAPSNFIAACEGHLQSIDFRVYGPSWNAIWSGPQLSAPLQLRHLSIGEEYVDTECQYNIRGLEELVLSGPFKLETLESARAELGLGRALQPFKSHRLLSLAIELSVDLMDGRHTMIVLTGVCDAPDSLWAYSLTSLRLLIGPADLHHTVLPNFPACAVPGLEHLSRLQRLQGPFAGSETREWELSTPSIARLPQLSELVIGRWGAISYPAAAAEVDVFASCPLRVVNVASLTRMGPDVTESLPFDLEALVVHHAFYGPEVAAALPLLGRRLTRLRALHLTLEHKPQMEKQSLQVQLDLSDARALAVVDLAYDRFLHLHLVLPSCVRTLALNSSGRTREETLGQVRTREGVGSATPEHPCLPPALTSLTVRCCPWRAAEPLLELSFGPLLSKLGRLQSFDFDGAAEIQDMEELLEALSSPASLPRLTHLQLEAHLTPPPPVGAPRKQIEKRRRLWAQQVTDLVEDMRTVLDTTRRQCTCAHKLSWVEAYG